MPDDAEPWPDSLFRAEPTGEDNDPIVIIEGELDASANEWLVACVAAVLAKHPTSIAIDAHGLSYLDSSGLRSMLIARAAAEEAGVPLRITQPSPALRRMVERTGLQNQLLDE